MSTDLVQAKTTITAVPAADAPEMPAAQITALDALLSGKTATDAAAAAGIGRRTLYDWLQKDFRFRAALNRGRRELQQAVACRVEQLAADATECVASAVRKGDVKAALEILKRTNALAPQTIGSDDELMLQMEQEEQRKKRETRIAMTNLSHESVLSHSKLLSRSK